MCTPSNVDKSGLMDITFGTYPQGSRGKVMPIKWHVLEEDADKQLLISKFALVDHLFHREDTNITWNNCDLRKWLNKEFTYKAFTRAECKFIFEEVFILNSEEVNKYFKYDVDKICKPSKFINNRTCSNGACEWYLRDIDYAYGYNTCGFVTNDGSVAKNGIYVPNQFYTFINVVNYEHCVVRPAIWKRRG